MKAGSADRVERRLAAILAADIAGYSRLMEQDEAGTLGRLKELRSGLIDPEIAEHKGRIVKTAGDGMLVEFPSVVEAVACAIVVQRIVAERNTGIRPEQRIEFRVGINSGDVIVEDGDIHGDGVNIAARLEALAEPGGICVSALVHDQVRGRLNCSFADLGEQTLKNISRPVRVYRVALTYRGADAPPSPLSRSPAEGAGRLRREAGEAPPLPDNPSIAVLPFENMSGDPEQEYFADGMVEEIITALSRIRWLFVIARNSSFTYKGQAIDVKRIGRELGVRYVLQGSVRKGGGRVRITAQLIETKTGAHLWADRFDGSLEDVFDLQDQVAISVAGVIEPTLQAAEARRSAERPTTDLDAYDLYLRGVASFFFLTRDGIRRAVDLLDQAIACDPQYGPALSYAALCRMRLYSDGWSEEPERDTQEAVALARRALQVAGSDPVTLVNSAYVLGRFGEDLGGCIAVIDRALTLNPSYARGWYLSGHLRLMGGQPDVAIEHLKRQLRLSPRDRTGAPLTVLGQAYMFNRQFDDAVATLLPAIQEHPGLPAPYRALAACYAHMRRLDEARQIIERLRTITPAVIQVQLPFRRPEDRELLLSGLRLAIGEEA